MSESVKTSIENAIAEGVKTAVNSPVTDATRPDIPVIAEAAQKAAAPYIDHITDNEPFFQSRVVIGSVMTILGSGYDMILNFTDGTIPTFNEISGPLTAIIGAGFCLYARYGAKKPLGS